jgi:YHS domain-containing protein
MARLVLYLVLIVLVTRTVLRVWRGLSVGLSGGAPRSGVPTRSVQMARDPVCGTFVVPDRSLSLSVGSQQLHFCSPACRDAYRARAS